MMVGEPLDSKAITKMLYALSGQRYYSYLVCAVDLAQDMEYLLMHIPGRERLILVLRFGLYDGITRPLEKCSDIFDVHRERIRQIEAKALRILRTSYLWEKILEQMMYPSNEIVQWVRLQHLDDQHTKYIDAYTRGILRRHGISNYEDYLKKPIGELPGIGKVRIQHLNKEYWNIYETIQEQHQNIRKNAVTQITHSNNELDSEDHYKLLRKLEKRFTIPPPKND